MSTHCTIWVKEDQKIRGIYCHHDGYHAGVGAMLKMYYNNFEKARALVDLGHISDLSEKLAPADNEEHSFDKPAPFVTVAYSRDRLEPFRNYEIKIPNDDFEQVDASTIPFESYNYIFIDNEWQEINKSVIYSNKIEFDFYDIDNAV